MMRRADDNDVPLLRAGANRLRAKCDKSDPKYQYSHYCRLMRGISGWLSLTTDELGRRSEKAFTVVHRRLPVSAAKPNPSAPQ